MKQDLQNSQRAVQTEPQQDRQQTQVEITVGLIAKLQSAIHSINDLENTSEFVREIKQHTNRYVTFLEKQLAPIYKEMKLNEQSDFIENVQRIDDIAKEFTVTVIA
jgi:hypothetical protein